MCKRILSSSLVAFFFSFASVFAGNVNLLIVQDVEAEAGSTITIELEIQNDDDVIGFNCDIPLPEGFTLVEGSGEHFRTGDHQLSLSVIDDNVARLMLFSMTNAFLEGDEGVVAAFEVQTPGTPGNYTFDISGIPVIGTILNGEATNVITGTESGDVSLTGGEFTVSLTVMDEEENPLQGALVTINGGEYLTNEDGEADFQLFSGSYDYSVEMECLLAAEGVINVSDDLAVPVIMEGLPGDANGDGFVNVLDVLAIANYYASGNVAAFCFENADVNNDGVINVMDVLLVSSMFAGDNKMLMQQGLNSEDAHAYLNPDGISLTSDGTLAGFQFELKGDNLSSLTPKLKLADHHIVYGYDEGVFRAIVFNLNNKPIPQGTIGIVTFDDHAGENLAWSHALAGNLIADEVPVHTHTGEVTGIEDIAKKIDYRVFPNPAENVFWVSFNNQSNHAVSLSLVNIRGQTIQQLTADEKGYSETEFNVHDLPAGMYIIRLNYKGQTVMDKIMLQ